MTFFVSRQSYWGADPDERYVVEIADGGRDYANPDMLCAKYPGEGREYEDAPEALSAAYKIAARWRADEPSKQIGIARGHTLGFTSPFEPSSVEELERWADKRSRQKG